MRSFLSRIRRPRLFDRLARNRRGATAVEFALISIPFFALICGIVEIGLIFFISTTLEAATNAEARQIRTGQMQNSGTASATSFVNGICTGSGGLAWLSGCSSNLFVDVRTFSTFATVNQPSPIQNGQLKQSNLLFNIGGAGNIVLVRTFYSWTLMAPMLDGLGVQPLSNGQYIITSAAAFCNEPYSSSGGAVCP
jgi:Flp pilus assembly protein TadG